MKEDIKRFLFVIIMFLFLFISCSWAVIISNAVDEVKIIGENNQENNESNNGPISTSIKVDDIYNGYIYANIKNNTSYETEFAENLEININQKELADELFIDLDSDFLNKNNEIVNTDQIVYKSTKIDKSNVLSIIRR